MRFRLGLLEGEHANGINVGVDRRFLTQQEIPFRSFARVEVGEVARVVQLVPLDVEEADAETAFLSPMLAMRFDRGLLLERFLPQSRPRLEAKLTPLTVKPGQCPADLLSLKSIDAPPYEDALVPTAGSKSSTAAEALSLFFRGRTQFVAEGDVLAIRVGTRYPSSDPLGGMRYYRVVETEPADRDRAWTVHPSTTRLCLHAGFCAGFLPPVRVEDEVDEERGPLLPHWSTLAKIVAPLLVRRHEVSYRLGLLLHGSVGKTVAAKQAARALGLKCLFLDAIELCRGTLAELVQELESHQATAKTYAPCFVVIRRLHHLVRYLGADEKDMDAQVSSVLTSTLHSFTQQSSPDAEKSVILVATCADPRALTPSLRHVFTHEIRIPPLEEPHKTELLDFYFHKFRLEAAVEDTEAVRNLIRELLPSPTPRELYALCYRLRAAHRTTSLGVASRLGFSEDDQLTLQEVEDVLTGFQLRTGSAKTAAEIPRVEWSDVGGLDDVKALIKETVELPIKHRSLFATGLHKRLGVLLHGPPGVGKTLLAKAIATECKTKFMSIKGPELLDMYVGETERKLRDLFDRAKKASPCILFFDELDAFAPSRGAKDSGAIMDRVVSQFLAELDGVSAGQHDVFVFGATNRIDLIDPALLRPGRLDKLVEVRPPETAEDKTSILESLTRAFHFEGEINLLEVAQRAKEEASGADLYAVCAEAWTQACKRHITERKGDQAQVHVRQEDFLTALEGLRK